jgi:5'-deoxynucleotidase YfbR-like HD superfamily hydrolase
MSQQLYDRLCLARDGSAVERSHVRPHLQRYSVGHHSLDMVTLLTLCWQYDHQDELPRAELLIAAAFHDVPEGVTGDIASHVKHHFNGLHDAEYHVLNWLGVNVVLTGEEDQYLRNADKLELWLWCWEEASRGNENFVDWADSYTVWFRSNPPPPSMALVIKEVLMNGRRHFSDQMGREALGTDG